MRKIILLLVFSSLVFFSCKQESKVNTLSQEEIAAGWQLLFDGQSLDQWRNFKSDSMVGWAIEDSCMVALGLGGDHSHDIISKEQYENFELYAEWKVTPEANSGIFYLAQELDSIKAIYEVAPEYQVVDDEGWPTKLGDWQKTAAYYAMIPADSSKKKLNPVGTYNSSKIVVNKGRVEHWLNDVKLVEYELWTPEWDSLKAINKWKDFPYYGTARNGHIGLQDHGKKVFYRNVKIRKL